MKFLLDFWLGLFCYLTNNKQIDVSEKCDLLFKAEVLLKIWQGFWRFFSAQNSTHFSKQLKTLESYLLCVFFETCFCFLCLRCDKVQKWKVNSVSKIRSVFVQKNIIHLCKVTQLPYKGGIKGDNMQVGILKRSCLGNVSSPAGIS